MLYIKNKYMRIKQIITKLLLKLKLQKSHGRSLLLVYKCQYFHDVGASQASKRTPSVSKAKCK